ncbi:M28 family peptidase [Winogradskyella sp. 3972H.M.0a.05]|uniref:M28 family peptidase n=1 Tax=Winogradskyella sp. 3972H.M.0a.05 TaxID=2950277 RepID=UPI00339177E9
MNKLFLNTLCCVLFAAFSYGQTIQDLMDAVTEANLQTTVNEFSGAVSTTVGGNPVTITNRQQANNDLAADYLVEQFMSMDNLTITDQAFNTNGRNIIATQLGKTNPDDIYMICAHYDTVADFCADDNATGTTAVLEIARILSTQCFDNTIIYALWDEEEIGLRGSSHYANLANTNGDNILGVLNMDMMGYDGDSPGQPGDNEFDIDVRNFANSIAMKDDIIDVLNAYTFDLSVIVVDPGTAASDHASFWGNGYSAVLVGESWETNDQTPFYHTSGDVASTLDYPYFTEMTKLVLAYTATKGSLVAVDNTVTQTPTMLTSNQSSATYQWYDCDTDTAIAGETGQSLTVTSNGVYRVEVTIGTCTEVSDCIVFDTLSTEEFETNEITIFPNPVSDSININTPLTDDLKFKLIDVSGKVILTTESDRQNTSIDVSKLASGVYFLSISTSEKSGLFKIVKE